MKNIRKFETTADMEAAVLEEVSINYNVETDGMVTLPSVIPPMKNYFRFVAVEDSNISLNGVDMQTMAPVCDINLQYNKNGDGWIDWDFTSIHLSAGETLYLRGNNENGFSKLDMYNGTGRLYMFTDMTGSNNGSTNGVYECHGDIMSLVYGDDFMNHSAIPNDGCFAYMFALCDGLLTSPELTAEALTDTCYAFMFLGCANLKEITMLAGEIPSEMCLYNWVASMSGNGSGVSKTGTFYKNPACELPIASDENGYGGIPEGWDVVESAKLNECISLAIVADDVHYGNETTTTVHYTAIGNHRDENGNITVSGIIVTGVTESDPFPQNLSTTETVQREVTFTYMGCTAKTVVTHGVFVPYEEQYLTFKAIKPGKFAYENDISYSLDYGNTWEALPANEETPLIPSGKHVLWKREYVNGNTGGSFESTGDFKVYGNIMSLTYGDNFIGQTSLEGKNYSHRSLFAGCTQLIDASALCLPATILIDDCYDRMFSYCTNLTTAPELPATTLANGCYSCMFEGCTSLTTAPELPATTLAGECYKNMFSGCENLTTAPELPATTLANYCYKNMFYRCRSLNHITMLATDISATYCLSNWVSNVSSTGTFINSSELVTLPIGPSGIPSGWTIENAFECEAVSLSITGDNVDFYTTSTTIHYESVVNLYNKDGEVVDTITVTGTAQSEPFPQNTSETDIVERTISFTFYGKTATTTITQGKYNHYYSDYTTFEALEDGTFSFKKNGTGDNIQYSKDNGTTWTSLASGETVSVVTGEKVMWKSTIIPKSSYGIGTFSSSNKFNVSGNIMSLLYGDDFVGQTSLEGKKYVFYRLFYSNGGLIDTSNLILYATTLAEECYADMFQGCTGLTTAPELPATTLTYGCYNSMFMGCESLTKSPVLPATKLHGNCYHTMFEGCTSLTTAPELPATTLSSACYQGMFSGCTNLTTAPELPATTLPSTCYYGMFNGCTNLTMAPELPATTLADVCCYQMFKGCTSLTTAPSILPATTMANRCYEGMFYKCASLTTAPELPATTLAGECYKNMFSDCKSLTTAPELPATTLAVDCYAYMFSDCKSLTTAPELPATTLAYGCYMEMFDGCASLTTAPELPATTLADYCYQYMFEGCTSLTTAPELPATTLADSCYSGMFQDCTSLTSAPELPVTTLTNSCYSGMFSGCTSLTTAPELPATTLAKNCYYDMFSGCTSLTTAPELPATTLDGSCYHGMFWGCTSLTTVPELPATTLTVSCYQNMFRDCTSMATAPELPATTMANRCYEYMFSGCTNLVTAPELPATTLDEYSYYGMFAHCSGLTTAPELPATTLANACYQYMFSGCTNLNHITMLATDISANNSLYKWVASVSSTGTFVKHPDMVSLPTGVSGIPNGWTVEDAVL